ncbi:MAG: ABC transporter substrate-binding protein [Dehalococcoidia bacterium]
MEEKGYWQRFWQRRVSRRRVITGAALGGGGLAAAAVIGCGGEEEKVATPTPAVATPTPTPTAAPPAVQPVRGGTLDANIQADPTNLDPYKAVNFINYDVASAWFSRLWMYTHEQEGGRSGVEYNKFDLSGDLAQDVEVSADLTTYTYKLRPGTTWQNVAPLNGRALTSEDIKLSADKFMDPQRNVQAQIFTDVVAVETPDPQTVVFKLKSPNAWWTNVLAHHNMLYITPAKEEVSGAIDILKTPLGSGPFIFEKWDESVAITGRGNPDYHLKSIYDGQPLPYVAALRTIIQRDPAAKDAAFRAGDWDIMSWTNMSPLQMKDLAKVRNGGVDFASHIGMWGVTFQSSFPEFQTRTAGKVKPYDPNSPFNDERVRKAISMAIDRDAVLKVVQAEEEGTWESFVTAGMSDFHLDPRGPEFQQADVAKWFKFDVAEAKRLMAAAGLAEGFGPIRYHGSNVVHLGGSGKARWEAVGKMVEDIGIKPDFQLEDHPTVWIVRTWRGETTGFGHWITGGKGVVFEFLRDTFSTQGYGHHGIADPTVDDFVLNKMKQARTLEERKQITTDFQIYMAQKMYMVPEVNDPSYVAWQPWVKNHHRQTWFDFHAETYPFSWLEGKPS